MDEGKQGELTLKILKEKALLAVSIIWMHLIFEELDANGNAYLASLWAVELYLGGKSLVLNSNS